MTKVRSNQAKGKVREVWVGWGGEQPGDMWLVLANRCVLFQSRLATLKFVHDISSRYAKIIEMTVLV